MRGASRLVSYGTGAGRSAARRAAPKLEQLGVELERLHRAQRELAPVDRLAAAAVEDPVELALERSARSARRRRSRASGVATLLIAVALPDA